MSFTLLNNIFGKMAEVNLAVSTEAVVICPDRDSADVIAEAIRENIEANDHIVTGNMLEKTRVRRQGDEYAVVSTNYAKYVNGNSGFIDEAVADAWADGYDGDLVI